MHPILIPTQCIDLAVVYKVTRRTVPSPTRKYIGAEAGVNHGDGGFDARVGKIRIEGDDLSRCQHALIDDRSGRHTWDIKEIPAWQSSMANGVFRAAPDDVELALKRLVVLHCVAATDKNLPYKRLA